MMIRSRAPLRLGLAGGGTDVSPYCDVYGGAILNVTIDYYAYVTLEINDTATIAFTSADQNLRTEYSVAAYLPFDGKLDLYKAVYNYIVREHNAGVPISVSLQTHVDVPAGSGLGASSTLVVAMVTAFSEALGIPFGEYEVAQAAFAIERNEAKLHGGKQDQYAAAFGGFNFMEFAANNYVLVNPLRIKDWVISELEASLILFYTGQSRTSAEIIKEQSHNVQAKNLVAIEAMHNVKSEAMKMKEALLRGDFQSLYQVMRTAWDAKKKMAAQISNDRIEAIYQAALNSGAYCGKISGAGGGGFMMFLVDPMFRKHVEECIQAASGGAGAIYKCHFTFSGSRAWRVR